MNTGAPWHKTLLAIIAGAILIAGIALFLYKVRGILPPFVIAFAIAWLLDPLLDRMQRMGCSRMMAITGVYALFLGAFLLGLIYLVPAIIVQASQFADDFPTYAERARTFANDFMASNETILARFKLPTTLHEVFAKYGSQVSGSATSAVTMVTKWIAANVSKALWLILIPLIAFYFLTDIDRIRKRSAFFIPEQWRDRTIEVLSKVGAVFSNYIRGLLIICLMYGVAATLLLVACRVDYAIILGLLAGILYAVPYIGAFATVVIVFLVSLATYQPRGDVAVWLPPAIMVVQNFLFDNLVMPKVVGKSVGLHPVLSLFAMMAGGQLFGLAGMVLSVPIAASIQEIFFEFKPELRAEQVKKRKPLRKTRKPRPEKKVKTAE